jgi:hypothetical protein
VINARGRERRGRGGVVRGRDEGRSGRGGYGERGVVMMGRGEVDGGEEERRRGITGNLAGERDVVAVAETTGACMASRAATRDAVARVGEQPDVESES